MKLIAAVAALMIATPAAAEHITTYWQLEATTPVGVQTVPIGSPALVQRILPVKLVRLSGAAVAAGGATVPAGTVLYLVVNDAGKAGYCPLKDRSGANQSKSLFIPALDKRPCFVDRDGDGRFDASFGVFDAYTLLSPPQARGNIDAAQAIATPVAYEVADVHDFPANMTLTYVLVGGDTPAKTRMSITLDRPGHTENVERKGVAAVNGSIIAVLGTIFVVRDVSGGKADVDIVMPPRGYIYGDGNGTGFTPVLPATPAFK